MDYEIVKLNEIADFNKESIGKNSNYDFINYLDTANITNGSIDTIVKMNIEEAPSRAKRIVKKDDIIYSTVRPNLCHYGIIDSPVENMIVSTGFTVISCKDSVNPYYIYNYLTQKDITLRLHSIAENSTSAYPSIKPSDLEDVEIKLPKLEIQNKIAKLLTDIDKKIRVNNEINNNLYELEKNLYKEYFKKLDDSNSQKLSELCKIKYGKGLPTTKIENEGYPVYGGNGIIGYYHEFMYEDSQVLISCRGAASGNVIVSKPQSFVTNNSLILECDRKYHHYLKQYSLDSYYYEYTTGSAQPQITIDNIKDIALNIPSEELLEKFNEQMEPLENKYFSNLEENNKLEQLRDTLLPKLMNGEIDLDNIEI